MALQLIQLCVAVVGADPAFTIVTIFSSYQNQYYEILLLDEQCSRQISQTGPRQQAQQLADKILHHYESLDYLSFTQTTSDLWCTEGSPRSYLPMTLWPQESVATAHAWMAPNSLHTEVFSENQHIYSLFLQEMQCLEYRWPSDDNPGEYTEYYYDPRCYRFRRGIAPHLMCITGTLRKPWLGQLSERPWNLHAQKRNIRMSSQPQSWHQLISDGRRVGQLWSEGNLCDVVILDMDDIDRRDIYLIDSQGFITSWYIIIRDPENHKNKFVVLTRYHDISTAPIPNTEFEPSPALRQASAGWRKLSDAESLAEMEEIRGEPLTPAWLAAADTDKETRSTE